jgi:hypothetical protein
VLQERHSFAANARDAAPGDEPASDLLEIVAEQPARHEGVAKPSAAFGDRLSKIGGALLQPGLECGFDADAEAIHRHIQEMGV